MRRAELRTRYPAILAHASLSYCDGWAGIMETLCERLQFHADHNAMPPVEITQAKEKHGELSVNRPAGAGLREQLRKKTSSRALRRLYGLF